ncbi:hypothetical protein BLNAU_1549 [Blattamonas nauphoetae]|uniref:Uncharacterized protein n=1 Tax=Blattamonas nauphoetae TaxID=2049346 RepID=A0ABQ9YIB9_9EUKA|nr:hypothetical protein BLNAU_1549 [Blattamonas nauphoetae]
MESPTAQLVITIIAFCLVFLGLLLFFIQAAFYFAEKVPHRVVSSFISIYTSLVLRPIFIPLLVLLLDPSVCMFSLQNPLAQYCHPTASTPLAIVGLILAIIYMVWNLIHTALVTTPFRSSKFFFAAQQGWVQTIILSLVCVATSMANEGSNQVQTRELFDSVNIAARGIKNNIDLHLKLRYLYHTKIMSETEVITFTDSLFVRLLNRGPFSTNPSTYLAYALFLGSHRPSQRVNIVLTRVAELFPSFTTRFVMYRYIKDIEAVETKHEDPVHVIVNTHNNSRAAQVSMTARSEEAMKHAEEGISNFVISKEMIQELLKEDPRNPAILRQYAHLVREIEGDLVTAKACLVLAENVEDVLLQEDTERHMLEIEKGMKEGAINTMDFPEGMFQGMGQLETLFPQSSPEPATRTFQQRRKTREDLGVPNALEMSIWETKEKISLRPMSLVIASIGLIVVIALLTVTFVYVLLQSHSVEPETHMIRSTIAGSVEMNFMFEMMLQTLLFTKMLTGVPADDEDILVMLNNNQEYSQESVLYLNDVLYSMLKMSEGRDDWSTEKFSWIVPIQNGADKLTVDDTMEFNLNLFDLINWIDDLLFESIGPDLDPITNRDEYLHATVTAGLTIPFAMTEEMKRLMFDSSARVEAIDSKMRTVSFSLFIVSVFIILTFIAIPPVVLFCITCSAHAKSIAHVCEQSVQQAEDMLCRFNQADNSQTMSQTESSTANEMEEIVPITPTRPKAILRRQMSIGVGMMTDARSLASLKRSEPVTPMINGEESKSLPLFPALSQASNQLSVSRKQREKIRKKERERRERAQAQTRELRKARMENERMLRIEFVESSLSDLRRHSLPTSLIVRYLVGILLIIVAMCGFFLPISLIVPRMRLYSSRVIVNEYRRVFLCQISMLGNMLVSNFTIKAGNADVIMSNTQYGTPCFTNTSNLQSIEDLQSTMSRVATAYSVLNQIFILGSEKGLLTGDDYLDGIEVASSRNFNEAITDLFTKKAVCYDDPDSDEACTQGRVDGLDFWYGIDELLQRVAEAAFILANTKPDELSITSAENNLITQLSWEDLDCGLQQMGVILEDVLDSFTETSRMMMLVLTIVFMILTIAVPIIFIFPLPFSTRKISGLTQALEKYGIVRELRSPQYPPAMETSLPAVNAIHKRIHSNLVEFYHLVNDETVMRSDKSNQSQNVLLEPLMELMVDLVEMFAIEEALMTATMFPTGAMAQHLQAHVDSFIELLKMYELVLQNKVKIDDGVIFTESWLKDHISSDDHLLGVFVVEALDKKELTAAIKKAKKKKDGFVQFPPLMGRMLLDAQIVEPEFLQQILKTNNILL